jgi:hypothetical protein
VHFCTFFLRLYVNKNELEEFLKKLAPNHPNHPNTKKEQLKQQKRLQRLEKLLKKLGSGVDIQRRDLLNIFYRLQALAILLKHS